MYLLTSCQVKMSLNCLWRQLKSHVLPQAATAVTVATAERNAIPATTTSSTPWTIRSNWMKPGSLRYGLCSTMSFYWYLAATSQIVIWDTPVALFWQCVCECFQWNTLKSSFGNITSKILKNNLILDPKTANCGVCDSETYLVRSLKWLIYIARHGLKCQSGNRYPSQNWYNTDWGS